VVLVGEALLASVAVGVDVTSGVGVTVGSAAVGLEVSVLVGVEVPVGLGVNVVVFNGVPVGLGVGLIVAGELTVKTPGMTEYKMAGGGIGGGTPDRSSGGVPSPSTIPRMVGPGGAPGRTENVAMKSVEPAPRLSPAPEAEAVRISPAALSTKKVKPLSV